MTSYSGGFQVSVPCDGATITTTVQYEATASPQANNVIYAVLHCGEPTPDCENVIGGNALPGTPCDDGDPNTYLDTWSGLCQCTGGPGPIRYFEVTGTMDNCVAGSSAISIAPFGTHMVNMFTTIFPNSDCTYSHTITTVDSVLHFEIGGYCQHDDPYAIMTTPTWHAPSTLVVADFICGINVDCLGMAGGAAVSGTPCNDDDPLTTGDTWSADCECIGTAPIGCNACFTLDTAQQVAWQATFLNCSNGGVSPYAYFWTFSNGSTSTPESDPTITFTSAGAFAVCLTTFDSNVCEDMTCVTVHVDTNGNILENVPGCQACLTIVPATDGPAGPAIPWTVDLNNCSFGGEPTSYVVEWGDGETGQPGTHEYSSPGTYEVCLYMSAIFICEDVACTTVVVGEDGTVNPITTDPCTAEFFAMQAYQWVDSASNPNGGGGEPIPNELWIWNLSSGGTGFFQFTWSFGDGTSSTDAYPTHTYASGEYELCLTILDNAGCTDEFCDTVSVDGDGILNGLTGGTGNRNAFTIRVMDPLTTGVNENPVFTELTIWPNPVDNELNITLNSALQGKSRVTLTDLSGRIVMGEDRVLTTGQNKMIVPVSDLKAGIYLVKLSNGTSTVSGRFVKVY